jgi:hypothetical protein
LGGEGFISLSVLIFGNMLFNSHKGGSQNNELKEGYRNDEKIERGKE